MVRRLAGRTRRGAAPRQDAEEQGALEETMEETAVGDADDEDAEGTDTGTGGDNDGDDEGGGFVDEDADGIDDEESEDGDPEDAAPDGDDAEQPPADEAAAGGDGEGSATPATDPAPSPAASALPRIRNLRWKTSTRTLTERFTDGQKAELAGRIFGLQDRVANLEEELKDAKESIKGRIAEINTQLTELRSQWRVGGREIVATCREYRDFEAGEVLVVRVDTEEVVEVRAMRSHERQQELDLETAPPPPPPAAEPPADAGDVAPGPEPRKASDQCPQDCQHLSWVTDEPACSRTGDAACPLDAQGAAGDASAPAAEDTPSDDDPADFARKCRAVVPRVEALPTAAADFVAGLPEKLEGMATWAEEHGHVTETMAKALEGIEGGVARWEEGDAEF